MANYLILLFMFSLGLIIISSIVMIYILIKHLKEDTNAYLFILALLGIVLSLLISTTLGIIKDI